MEQTCTWSNSQTKLQVHQSHLMPYVKTVLPPHDTEGNFLAGLHWLVSSEKLPKSRGHFPDLMSSLCQTLSMFPQFVSSSLCCGRETHLRDLAWVHRKETTPAINLTDTLAEQQTRFGDQNVA